MRKSKTYYCVAMVIYDNRKPQVTITTVAAGQKPKSTFKETARADYYTDYFDTREEAERFVKGE